MAGAVEAEGVEAEGVVVEEGEVVEPVVGAVVGAVVVGEVVAKLGPAVEPVVGAVVVEEGTAVGGLAGMAPALGRCGRPSPPWSTTCSWAGTSRRSSGPRRRPP